MKFKDKSEFVKVHNRICIGQLYGGVTIFGGSYLFCKLCNSLYRNGSGQLDDRMVKEFILRINDDICSYYKEHAKDLFDRNLEYAIKTEDEP